jgi:hypothetical protein
MRVDVWLLSAAILVGAISAAGGQEKPATACTMDEDVKDRQLSEIATTKPTAGYMACTSKGGCVSLVLPVGDPILVYKTEGPWTCGYHQGKDGDGPVWVQAKDLRPVPADPHPPLKAWLGTWSGGEDRVSIKLAGASGQLTLKGSATWHGQGDVVHDGEFEGVATPYGNRLHFEESGADSCTVDLTLVGRYVIAEDNSECGGMNVRFGGIWKRAAP